MLEHGLGEGEKQSAKSMQKGMGIWHPPSRTSWAVSHAQGIPSTLTQRRGSCITLATWHPVSVDRETSIGTTQREICEVVSLRSGPGDGTGSNSDGHMSSCEAGEKGASDFRY